MFGIGQPKVEMSISPQSVGRGAILTGTVQITGGTRLIPATAFEARLRQRTRVKTKDGMRTDSEVLFEETAPQGGAIIEPGATMSWSFVLQVPADAAPTSSDVEYEVEASLDCPGWDPSSSQALTVTSEIDAAAGEDLKKYHVLPKRHSFRHSSVKGDFRVLPCEGGFVTTWKTEISVRNHDGSSRCRIPGWGKSMAVSPDGKRLVASNKNKGLAFFDLATGDLLGEVLHMDDWVMDTLWLKSGAVLASSSKRVSVLNDAGEIQVAIDDLDGEFYVGGLAQAPDGFFLTDSNGGRLLHVSEAGEVLASTEVRNPSAVFAGKDSLTIECHRKMAVADFGLSNVKTMKLPGKVGVRYAGAPQLQPLQGHASPVARR